ncbi:MAG: response regulator transcription factor [Flavobacteriales bacterium]
MAKNELSPREKEIILLMCEEYTSKQIASKLNISVRTIDTHRKNILWKTDCLNLAGLVKYAIRNGWVKSYKFIE